ncbi:hypothetical protein H1C71_032498, partial [Ictidomys tridecemlineatus]
GPITAGGPLTRVGQLPRAGAGALGQVPTCRPLAASPDQGVPGPHSPRYYTEGVAAAVPSSQHSWDRGDPEPNVALNALCPCTRQWKTGVKSPAPSVPRPREGRRPRVGPHDGHSAARVLAASGPQTPGKGQKQALGRGAVDISLHRAERPRAQCQAW